jgi:hypothetical protein
MTEPILLVPLTIVFSVGRECTLHYWKLLMDYETIYRNDTFSGNEVLSPDFICAPGPGRGYEQDYGYKLLTEKIRIHPSEEASYEYETTRSPC